MKKFLSILSLVFLISACGTSTKTTTKTSSAKPVDPTTYGNTITAEELKTALYTFASNDFEGRETGQPGQKKAVNFLKDNYIKMGVPAAKGGNDYFQKVKIEISETPEATMVINGVTLNYVDDFVSAGSASTSTINASEIIDAGFGIETDTYSSYKNIDVKGKVVLIKSGEPKKEDGTYLFSGNKETSKWSDFRQQFAAKRDIAKEKGAAVVLFDYPEVYPMAAARFGHSSGRMSLSGNKNGMFYFLVKSTVVDAIKKTKEATNGPITIPAKVTLNYKNNSKPVDSENVAAFIKGTEKPNEIIVISAHLDHEGIKDGEVYNGADDDGSGTVAVLKIAKAFAQAKKDGNGPKRSLLFLNVTGEEKGLLGSKYYTDYDPIFPLENTMANLNIDMIGRTDPKRKEGDRNYVYLIGSDKLSTDLHNISEQANKTYTNVELDYTYNDENDPNRFYYRSDHYNFAKNNIPVIFYFNGTHADYHKASDTPDKIEYDLLENRTRLVFYTTWELANREAKIIVDKAE